jgi:hypothetical protein
MNLDQQIQALIEDAPQDGTTPRLVATIAPVLKVLATQLRHREYYILQNLQEEWVLTTLSNRVNPQLEKYVIYAFPTAQDATLSFTNSPEARVLPRAVPTIRILFQMVALETVDSLIFFETPGNLEVGTEIRREDLQNLIQMQLQQLVAPPNPFPPDIA